MALQINMLQLTSDLMFNWSNRRPLALLLLYKYKKIQIQITLSNSNYMHTVACTVRLFGEVD